MLTKDRELRQKLNEIHFYWKIGYYALQAAGWTHLFFFFIFLYLHIPVMVAVNVLSVAIYFYSIYGLGMQTIETKNDRLIGWLVYCELIIHNLLATWYLSTQAGFQYYIYALAILPFFIFSYNKIIYWFRILLAIAVSLAIEVSHLFLQPKVSVSPEIIEMLHLFNLLVFLVVLSALSYLYTYNERHYHDKLYNQSILDPMTGLYNRHHIHHVVESMWGEMFQSPSTVLMLIDIDYLKRINDTLGHNCGDKAITILASKLKEIYHDYTTIISRWGGDEFLLIIRDIQQTQLEAKDRQLRQILSKTNSYCENSFFSLSISAGATFTKDTKSFHEALERADKALYKAKEAKNRLCIL